MREDEESDGRKMEKKEESGKLDGARKKTRQTV